MYQPPPRLEKLTDRANLRRRMPRHAEISDSKISDSGGKLGIASTGEELRNLAFENALGNDMGVLTEQLQRPRFRLSQRAMRSLIILLGLMMGGLGISVFTQLSHSDSAAHSAPPASPPAAAEEVAKNDSAVVGKEALIYVTGAVKTPGVVSLRGEVRVQDALEAAGGFSETADKIAVNLAAPVHDGEHLHFPAQGEVPSGGGAEQNNVDGAAAPINLNQADKEALQKIPGIGPTTAQNIVNWRTEKGPFRKVEDLLNIPGIGQKNLEKMKPYLTL